MNNLHSSECIDHPLGILCRCEEFKRIVDKFVMNSVGTRNSQSSHPINLKDPFVSVTIVWELQKAEANANPTKPVLHYNAIDDDKIMRVNASNVEKMWIPVDTNLVSAKELRPNMSYIHRTAQNTQSAEFSVLTDMLPHRGRAVKRKDVDWGIGSHETPVEMTDEPEINFSAAKGCFSTWAEAYTRATSRPAY